MFAPNHRRPPGAATYRPLVLGKTKRELCLSIPYALLGAQEEIPVRRKTQLGMSRWRDSGLGSSGSGVGSEACVVR